MNIGIITIYWYFNINMNDVEISNKGDEEILSLIRSYKQSGYQVWI